MCQSRVPASPYMCFSYHSLPWAGIEYRPKWMKMPSLPSTIQSGIW